MRSEQEIRELFLRAQRRTSAQAAGMTLVIPNEDQKWLILLQSGSEELAIEVSDNPGSTDEELKAGIVEQLKRLF